MKTDTPDKNCRNCKFFDYHYRKTETGFKKAICGSCTNTKLGFRMIRKTIFQIYDACEYWQPIEMQAEERKVDIMKTLRQMQESLKEIAFILKDDK